MYRIALCFVLIFGLLSSANAQNSYRVTGIVRSATDKSPIADVHVRFDGSAITTTTDSTGFFSITATEKYYTLVVYMYGYQQKTVKLKGVAYQNIEINLVQQSDVLTEVSVMPPKNRMRNILRKFNDNRKLNHPDATSNLSTEKETISKLSWTHIQPKTLEKLIFPEMRKGAIVYNDTLYKLPLHYEQTTERITFDNNQKRASYLINDTANTINLLRGDRITQILNTYKPHVDFYSDNILLLDKMFHSPTSVNGLLYYNYTIADSIFEDNTLVYFIRFSPKNKKSLAFVGSMEIDATNYALRNIKATVQSSANLNFVEKISFDRTYYKLPDSRYFYNTINDSVGFVYTLPFFIKIFAAEFSDNVRYYNINSDTSKNDYLTPIIKVPIEITDSNRRFLASIDALNNTKFQKVLNSIANMLFNGYITTPGKIEWGAVYDLIRFNELEGFRSTLSLRTGRTFSPDVSIGAYIGYGFRDKRAKYGANVQYMFGYAKQHYLGAFYNKEVYSVGYDNKRLLAETMFGGGESLLTSFSWGQLYDQLIQKRHASILYYFERHGVKLSMLPSVSRSYSNQFVPFIQQGTAVEYMDMVSFASSLRLSFKERYIKGYMKKLYLKTQYPIITLLGEIGGYRLHLKQDLYAKLSLTVKYNFATSIGKFYWSLYATKIFGAVPYTILEQPFAMQGLWHNAHDFNLVNQTEFLADTYGSMFFRYYTYGLVFNNIPLIKSLNLRETLLFNAAWGSLSDRHTNVMDMPATSSLNPPYIEVGVGVANIMSIFAIESVWRLTHRDYPQTANWGIRARFYFDF